MSVIQEEQKNSKDPLNSISTWFLKLNCLVKTFFGEAIIDWYLQNSIFTVLSGNKTFEYVGCYQVVDKSSIIEWRLVG